MSRGTFVGAVFVSVLLTLGMVYFVVPMFYNPPGTIIQTKNVTTSAYGICWATNLNWAGLNATNTTLITKGGSHLQVTFECPFTLQYESPLSAGTYFWYEISLVVAGVKETNFTIWYTLSADSTAYGQVPVPVHMSLVTDILAAGSYFIGVNWVSHHSVGSSNCLKAVLNSTLLFPRTLIAQEISG